MNCLAPCCELTAVVQVLCLLALGFTFGSLVAYETTQAFQSESLLFNACFFTAIGIGCAVYLSYTHHINILTVAAGNWQWKEAIKGLKKTSVQEACDKMHETYLIDLFDIIDEDNFGFIQEASLGSALERVGIVLDPQTLALMIKV